MVTLCATGRAGADRACAAVGTALPPHARYASGPLERGGHLSEDGYIIEFHQVGSYVKVTAMDPATLTEVSIPVPANLSQRQAAEAVVRRLKYVLARRHGIAAEGTTGERK